MGIFYREKAFHAGKKIRKMDLYPLKNNPLMPLAVPGLSYRYRRKPQYDGVVLIGKVKERVWTGKLKQIAIPSHPKPFPYFKNAKYG